MIVGIGVDVVDIARVRKALTRTGERFVRRVYTEAEAEYCRRHRDPNPPNIINEGAAGVPAAEEFQDGARR